jgi:hypothetical protein
VGIGNLPGSSSVPMYFLGYMEVPDHIYIRMLSNLILDTSTSTQVLEEGTEESLRHKSQS